VISLSVINWRLTTRAAIAVASLALLAGCESMSGFMPLANRVSVSLDGREAYVNSMYGWIGITSKIAKPDAEALIEMQRIKARAEAAAASAPTK
jgi:hypothetical protein